MNLSILIIFLSIPLAFYFLVFRKRVDAHARSSRYISTNHGSPLMKQLPALIGAVFLSISGWGIIALFYHRQFLIALLMTLIFLISGILSATITVKK